MGQKVNPISMRLQVNKDWRSKWFASRREYVTFLDQDLKIRRHIEENLTRRAGIQKVDIERSPNSVSVTIYTAKPGVVIGRGGAGATELKDVIQKITGIPIRVNIEEVKKPELYAKIVAENIAHQLEKRVSLRRAMKAASAATMRVGAKGIRIELAGRLNNADMSRREKEIAGSVPLHTLRADVDYAQARAIRSGVGVTGVKVWIYKGETEVG
jgi:small subunit ribosomal protein S3